MVIVAELGRSRFANVGFGESAGQDYDWLLTSTRRQRWADELFLLRVTDDNNSRVYLRRLRLRSCDMGMSAYTCVHFVLSRRQIDSDYLTLPQRHTSLSSCRQNAFKFNTSCVRATDGWRRRRVHYWRSPRDCTAALRPLSEAPLGRC